MRSRVVLGYDRVSMCTVVLCNGGSRWQADLPHPATKPLLPGHCWGRSEGEITRSLNTVARHEACSAVSHCLQPHYQLCLCIRELSHIFNGAVFRTSDNISPGLCRLSALLPYLNDLSFRNLHFPYILSTLSQGGGQLVLQSVR